MVSKRKVLFGSALMAIPFSALAEVTLYGQAHISYDSLSNGKDSGEFVSSNSSRLGVKASRDFGGLTGLVQYETGVDLSNSASTWGATRDSYLGLKGGFGTVLGGRLPAANQWVYDANYFADQMGDAGNLTGAGLPGRADHALYYVLPAPTNFSVGITYVPKQSTSSAGTVLKSMSGIKAGYTQGTLAASLGYFDLAQLGKVTTASASYDFGAASVAGIVVNRDTKADAVFGGGTAKSKVTVYSVGGNFKVGVGALKAQFSRAGESASGAKDGATMLAVGYDHKLADNATAYIVYASVTNDTNGNYSASDWGHGSDVGVAAPGKDPHGFSLGVVIGF